MNVDRARVVVPFKGSLGPFHPSITSHFKGPIGFDQDYCNWGLVQVGKYVLEKKIWAQAILKTSFTPTHLPTLKFILCGRMGQVVSMIFRSSRYSQRDLHVRDSNVCHNLGYWNWCLDIRRDLDSNPLSSPGRLHLRVL